jgi:DNA topoisomerase-1
MSKSQNSRYTLVIVESPGKIKKLESFLGSQYKVIASYGHIIDLPKKALNIDIQNNFTPTYDIIKGEGFNDKTNVVENLKKMYKNASKIILAADDDREGEMIAWSYKKVLELGEKQYDRITFNSITKEEVMKAIAKPHKINELKVDSQKARRILDRIVGYKISPIISKSIGVFGLSAGRVQSVVVELICDKEKEIEEFFKKPNSSFFKINSNMKIDELKLACNLISNNANNINDNSSSDKDKEEKQEENIDYKTASKIIKDISESSFKIDDIIITQSIRKPQVPYITSSIQQEASSLLNFNVKRTMTALQNLYEAGYITYMRTDSPTLSSDAIKQCKDYIIEKWGKENYNKIEYKAKNENAQEAHEAIRPVKIEKESVEKNGKINEDEIKIYNLVWKRTVASQMTNAEVNVYNIYISISKNKKYKFYTKLEEVTKMGFFLLMTHKIPEDKFTKLKKNTKVDIIDVSGNETYKNPPSRYTEAGLVKKMESLSIGRPATYAQTISTIQEKYVTIKDIEGLEKKSRIIKWKPEEEIQEETKNISIGKEKNKFCSTELGAKVNELMLKHFPDIMKYEFTAEMEKDLDNIVEGKIKLTECLSKFWNKLEPLINAIIIENNVEKPKNIICVHPETKQEIIGLFSQYGGYLKMGDFKATIQKPLTLETITPEQAIKLFEYPKTLGIYDEHNVYIKKGLYGFYLDHNKITAPLKEDDMKELSLEKAIKILQDKISNNEKKEKTHLFNKKVGNLEYSIRENDKGQKYIMVKNMKKTQDKPTFISCPEDIDIKNITIDKIKEICKNTKPKKTYIKKA